MPVCSVCMQLCMHQHNLQRMQYRVLYRPPVTHSSVLQLLRAVARGVVRGGVRCLCNVVHTLMHTWSICLSLSMFDHTLVHRGWDQLDTPGDSK